MLVATPGRLEDLLARGAFTLEQHQDAGPRRGRPDARHGLSPGDRPDRRRVPRDAPDAVLLRHARRRSRTAGQALRARSRDPRARPDGTARERGDRAPVRPVEHEHRVEALVRELRRERDLTLVFVRTKHGADRLVKRLGAHGVEAVAMHGNKSQRQREQALARFESRRGRHARRDRRRRARHRRRAESRT